MNDSASSSSLSELIQNHMKSVHEIAQNGFNQNSISECFRNQVDDILSKNEEIISLTTKIKLMEESNKLQVAEFAFRSQQYEDEINALKQKENELIESLTKTKTQTPEMHKYDVQVMLEQKDGQISQINEKYNKWKNKYHTLSKENEQIKVTTNELQESNKTLIEKIATQTEEIEKLKQSSQISSSGIPERHTADADIQQMNSLSSQIQVLKGQLEQSKSESQSIIDDLNSKIDKLNEENQKLISKIENANKKIIKQQVRIGQLSDENKSYSSSMEITNHMEQENQHLKAKINQYRKQRKDYEDHIKQLNSTLQRVELERDGISDILGVEADELDSHWENIASKIEQLVDESSKINELKNQNDKLQKRLNNALDESRKQLTNSQNAGKEGILSNLQTKLKDAKSELELYKMKMEKYQMRLILGNTIENMNHNLLNYINDLYYSLTGTKENTLRPIILSVILTKRFLKLHKIKSVLDPAALQVFGEFSSTPLATKIDSIRKSFTSLTQEMLVLKQTLLEANDTLKATIEERDIAQLTLKSNSDEIKLTRKKIDFLKNRMFELQDELSSLVSPEIYNNIVDRLNTIEKQNSSLSQRIKELEEEIDKRTELERTMNEKVEQLQIRADQNNEIAHQARVQYATKEEEVESLKSLLREKTKEILSLERLVHSQEQKESSTTATYTYLAVENQELKKSSVSKEVISNNSNSESTSDSSPEDIGSLKDLKKAIKVEINPAFLGK